MCDLLELMLSFSFSPRIIKPTRITSRSQTLIDNIHINELHSNIVAGNIATDISDHLTQFVAIPGDLVKTSIEGIIKSLILINLKKTLIKLTGQTYFLTKM